MTPLESLVASGTKLWLDSIDPDLVRTNRAAAHRALRQTRSSSADLIKSGRFDQRLDELVQQGLSDSEIAWQT